MKTKLIIITGSITSGKTSFLKKIVQDLKNKYPVGGFLSIASPRPFKSGKASRDYHLLSLADQKEFPWAKRKEDNSGYDFNEESKVLLTNQILSKPIENENEVLILDDMGMLEILGEGFDHFLMQSMARPYLAIVVSVKKTVIEEFIKRYSFQSALIVDLDDISPEGAIKKVKTFLYNYDSEKIAIYSAINAGVEMGIGSTLHSLHVPLKGHFLSFVQNFLLIQFAKELKGRNLFWIVFITSALKSFSPAGTKLKPMLYIFVQGGLFILPISLLGLNIFTVILGSIFLGISTLFLGLLLDYITFGKAVIEAYINTIQKTLVWLHFDSVSVWQFVAGIILLKVLIALILSFSYYLDFSPLMAKLKSRLLDKSSKVGNIEIKKQTFRESIISAFRDLITLRFVFSFVLLSLIIYFFSDITRAKFLTTLLRGLFLAWFGFLLARRIDFERIVHFLEKHDLGFVADSLKQALQLVLRNK